MRIKRSLLAIKLAAYILIPIILFILPSDYFDGGRDTCLSVILFNESCYACGMTRAMMRMIHFQFDDATDYNVLVLVFFPLLAFIWAMWFFGDLKKFRSYSSANTSKISSN